MLERLRTWLMDRIGRYATKRELRKLDRATMRDIGIDPDRPTVRSCCQHDVVRSVLNRPF